MPMSAADLAVRTTSNAQVMTDFVTTCAGLFFIAEEGHNPGVKTYVDALHYVATSLSVGYANIFPVTQMGKAIGAVVMMVGPALSAKALEEQRADETAAVVERLDAILAELRARP
jgi:hypothetical protein